MFAPCTFHFATVHFSFRGAGFQPALPTQVKKPKMMGEAAAEARMRAEMEAKIRAVVEEEMEAKIRAGVEAKIRAEVEEKNQGGTDGGKDGGGELWWRWWRRNLH